MTRAIDSDHDEDILPELEHENDGGGEASSVSSAVSTVRALTEASLVQEEVDG